MPPNCISRSGTMHECTKRKAPGMCRPMPPIISASDRQGPASAPLRAPGPVWPGSKPTLASTLERQDRQAPVVNGRKVAAVTAM
ncbi:hypothetical protein D8B29_07375 [Verminephrobacter eiseniae]|nr:hypothetical protein [Verminephrobacter eiseniae]MCW5284149.1 hypothetical protein [Verminephrobacter eiseniae]MCW5301857.1 hypothetical protein [Verminephrobacter eiseniae]MCW8179443.1 hypothetical protein [Verminephrobacter eiseniae]MCW8189627.1 hypothetical protein [Verminephrobacter eiseniae]